MKLLIQFTRLYLSLTVSLSALFTYLLAVETPSLEIIIPWLGVLLLALGTSGLNQIQEKDYDAKMDRTSKRPLVNKELSILNAYIISISLMSLSTYLLYYSMGLNGVFFSIFTIVTYNLIYTYMKRISYWALILGSLLGVVSPMIGWIVSGNSIDDIRFISLFLLFFIWQVPHFWLLMLMNGNDYEKAGFPTLKDKLGEVGLMRVISIWCYFVIFLALFMQYNFGVSLPIWIVLIIISLYMSYSSYLLFSAKTRTNKFFKIKFMELNTFVLVNIILLLIFNLA